MSDSRLASAVQIEYVPLGAVAQAYLNRDGAAACDDLLQDARRVSLNLLVDNPATIYHLLKFYGYQSTDISGASMWCVGGDPLAGGRLRFLNREPRGFSSTGNNEIRIQMTLQDGSPWEVYLSELVAFYDFEVKYSECRWELKRSGMAIPRRIYDPDCVYNSAQSEGGDRDFRSVERSQQPLAQSSSSGSNYVAAGRDWTRWQRFEESRREPETDRVAPFTARSKYPAIANDAAKGIL